MSRYVDESGGAGAMPRPKRGMAAAFGGGTPRHQQPGHHQPQAHPQHPPRHQHQPHRNIENARSSGGRTGLKRRQLSVDTAFGTSAAFTPYGAPPPSAAKHKLGGRAGGRQTPTKPIPIRTPAFLAGTPSSSSFDRSYDRRTSDASFRPLATPTLIFEGMDDDLSDADGAGGSHGFRSMASPSPTSPTERFGAAPGTLPKSRLFSPVPEPVEDGDRDRLCATSGVASGGAAFGRGRDAAQRIWRADSSDSLTPSSGSVGSWGVPPLPPSTRSDSSTEAGFSGLRSPIPSESPRIVHGRLPLGGVAERKTIGGQRSRDGGGGDGVASRPRLKSTKKIPMPDSKAFSEEESPRSSPMGWAPPVRECPPTPVRSPAWNMADAVGGGGDGPVRFNSLDATKILNSGEADILDAMDMAEREAKTAGEGGTTRSVVFARDFINEGTIGQGTSAIVFKCRRVTDNRTFAVKRSRKQFKGRTERELLLSEVRTLRSIGPHTNIVRVGVTWQEDLYFFTQYEFCARGTLKDFVKALAEPLPERTLWRLSCDACSALHHVHTKGWVHMDVKPANLLLTEDGVLKLGDFGMTVQEGSPGDGAEGDRLYMAVELLNCRSLHRSADLFSLGLSFLEVGYNYRLPNEGRKWHDIREGVMPKVLTTPTDGQGPHARSEQWQDFLVNLLQPRPEQRPDLGHVLSHVFMQEALRLCQEGVIDDFILMQRLPAFHEEGGLALSRFARAPSYDQDTMQF
mmetsp:Transcript_45981/g.143867  ORF Transcript_45981/g.143867 Transcript_45981/m.143867 type:complete len:740 (-) Transcript_45981:485-2704(-)